MSKPRGRAKPCPNCGLRSMLGQIACARLMDYCTTIPTPVVVDPVRAECICANMLPEDKEPRPCPQHGWLGEGADRAIRQEDDEFAPGECDGSGTCSAPIHVHGCYKPHRSDECDSPSEYGHTDRTIRLEEER